MADPVLDSVALLERRLARIELAVHGDSEEEQTTKSSVIARLDRINERLSELCRQTPAAAELLKLYERAPDLLQHEEDATLLSEVSSKAPVVFASASSLTTLRSQLDTLQSQSLPEATQMTTLISLQPKLADLQAAQQSQAAQVQQLRARSAALLADWYEQGVLQDGERWATVEQRLKAIELAVKRKESAQSRAAQEV